MALGTMVGCSLVMGEVPGKDKAGLTEDAGDSGVYDSGKWDTSIEHDARADVQGDVDAADAADVTVPDAMPEAGPCDGAPERVYFLDRDGDGHGFWPTARVACEPPSPGTWVTLGDDCHDDNADVYRGQQRAFPMHYIDLNGATSYDYDCDGVERSAGGQFLAPSVCMGLLCGSKGFLVNPQRPNMPGFNPLCGSNVVRECNIIGCVLQEYTVTEPFRCN